MGDLTEVSVFKGFCALEHISSALLLQSYQSFSDSGAM